MSERNGKPVSPYRRALERHRAEQAAWRRLMAARKQHKALIREIAQALMEYQRFCDGPLIDLPNGLAELPAADRELAQHAEAFEPTPANRAGFDDPPPGGLTAAQRAGFSDELPEVPKKKPKAKIDLPAENRMKAIEPAANDAVERLGQLLDGQDPSRGLNGQQADSSLPPWTSADLEQELLHAIGVSGGWSAADRPGWKPLIENGATNEQIGAEISRIWPRSRRFVSFDQSGGKLGYTAQQTGLPGGHYFWLGEFRGPGHKATLSGCVLIDRIRTVLQIPTPTQARKKAQDSFREPTVKVATGTKIVDASDFVPEPFGSEWDEASIKNALEDLGMLLPSQAVLCDECRSLRPRRNPVCPDCGSEKIQEISPPSELDLTQPEKRGRGRPKGSKTRKAAAT